MNQIIAFPSRVSAQPQEAVCSGDMAAAEAASSFVSGALPSLALVTGPLENRLQTLSHEAVDMVYAVIDAAVGSGQASVEECLLYELIHDEVARRCMIRGIPVPWDYPDELDGGAA